MDNDLLKVTPGSMFIVHINVILVDRRHYAGAVHFSKRFLGEWKDFYSSQIRNIHELPPSIFRAKCMPPQTKHQHMIGNNFTPASSYYYITQFPFRLTRTSAIRSKYYKKKNGHKNLLAPQENSLLLSVFAFSRRPSSTCGRVGNSAISRRIKPRAFFCLFNYYWCTTRDKAAIPMFVN